MFVVLVEVILCFMYMFCVSEGWVCLSWLVMVCVDNLVLFSRVVVVLWKM